MLLGFVFILFARPEGTLSPSGANERTINR